MTPDEFDTRIARFEELLEPSPAEEALRIGRSGSHKEKPESHDLR